MKFLTPIHENIAPTIKFDEHLGQESDAVFSNETANPIYDSSTAQLLSSYSGVVLAENNRDSGVPQSDQDNSTTSNGTPPSASNDNDQPLSFKVSFSHEESTDC